MAKKRLGYVELEWTCPHCGTNNPGPRGFCHACGAPQPKDVAFHQAPAAELLKDEESIRRAQAGADLVCPYCNARNPAGATFCGACGAGLGEADQRSSGRVVGAYRAEHQLEVTCTACGTLNTPENKSCRGCGTPLARERERSRPERKPARTRRISPGIILAASLACVALAVAAVSWLARTRPTTGRVETLEWQRSISIEAMVPIERQDWRSLVPAGAEILACESRLRETSDQPAPNAIEVCGTPYTIDTGSGYGEVVQDCAYEIYEDFCSYTALDWAVVEQVTASGTDLDPYWPEITLTGEQRLGPREETYWVVFVTEEGELRYAAEDLDLFRQFTLGSTWALEVNPLGRVVSASPAP